MAEKLNALYARAANPAQRIRIVGAFLLLLLSLYFVANAGNWRARMTDISRVVSAAASGECKCSQPDDVKEADSMALANGTQQAPPTKLSNEYERLITMGIHSDTVEGWRMRRLIRNKQSRRQINIPSGHTVNWSGGRKPGYVYFQDNWEPTFSCPYERRLGHWGDGGKWICNPHKIQRPAIVYSLGSNNDFSFEQAMHEHFRGQVELHTFDFGTPVGKPEFVNYHQYFIAAQDGGSSRKTGGVAQKTIQTIMEELGHNHIDIFKIDIEGHEMEVLLPLLEQGKFPPVDQMQIELHVADYFKPTPEQLDRFFTLLSEQEQMEIFHKEPNTKFGGGIACEYSLVKVDWKTLLPQITRE